jgi:hypothetical protein
MNKGKFLITSWLKEGDAIFSPLANLLTIFLAFCTIIAVIFEAYWHISGNKPKEGAIAFIVFILGLLFKWLPYLALVFGSLFVFNKWRLLMKRNIDVEIKITALSTQVKVLEAEITGQIQVLKQKPLELFVDNSTKPIETLYDFQGDWYRNSNTLVVRDNDAGGLTKIGVNWDNYQFTFKTRIVKGASGWIVRANNLNDYYLIQINSLGSIVSIVRRIPQIEFRENVRNAAGALPIVTSQANGSIIKIYQ